MSTNMIIGPVWFFPLDRCVCGKYFAAIAVMAPDAVTTCLS
jgi:hypothetical protein